MVQSICVGASSQHLPVNCFWAGGGPTGNKPAERVRSRLQSGRRWRRFPVSPTARWRLASHLRTRPSRPDSLWFLAPNVGAALAGCRRWRRLVRRAAECAYKPAAALAGRALGHWLTGKLRRLRWFILAVRLALGLQSGHIVLLTMVQWLAAACFQAPKPDPPTHLRLSGHTRAVTALLHPASLAPDRYNPIHLVSGAEDFSVALWDCESGSLIHRFCVHGGRLLNLRERRLLLLASRHLYPVLSVRWRPLEDLLVVHTSDNSAYVWQTEVPALDRIVSGPALEELLRPDRLRLWRVTKLRSEDSGGGRGLPIVLLHFNVACLIERILSNDQLARLRSRSRDSETQESSRSPASQLPDFPMLHRPELPCRLSTPPPPPAANATTGADEQALTLQVKLWASGRPYRPRFVLGLVRSRAPALLMCPNPPPHWETNRQLTTLHLLATTALAGALATARTASSFKAWPLDQPHRASLAAAVEDPTADNDPTAASNSASLPPPTAEQRQAWGLTLTHHTVLLADLLDPSLYQQPCLLSLAGLYHTASPHLRQAAQQLLMAELRRLGPAGRQELLGQHDLSLKTSLASLSDLNLTRAAAGALIRLLQEPGQAGARDGALRCSLPAGHGGRAGRLMPNSSDSLTASTDSAASATVALSWRVLSSETDLALQARLALTQISTSRPQLFLITMRRELLRYNTLATNAHLAGAKAPEQAPVYKGRSTILKLLELVCERAAADVHDLMFDTIELLLFCLEGQLTRDAPGRAVPAYQPVLHRVLSFEVWQNCGRQ
uniref:WD_REPEATS_REGION domain-containing protein n=1 Tax=Macrostomum lignano TaxID=282301 RepID=A0A1I8FDY3_9PLAT